MKKNMFALLLTLIMVFSMSTIASAYNVELEPADSSISMEKTTAKVTVYNHSNYLSDDVVEELKESISASIVSSNGERIPLDCTAVIEDMGSRQTGSRTYAVTVSAETKTTGPEYNDTDYDGVNAKAHITMVWTDVLGPANTIDNLSGGIRVYEGTLSNGKVSYGDTRNRPLLQPYFHTGTDKSFDQDVSYTSSSPTGSLYAYYQTWFEEWPSTRALMVSVSPSVFD